MTSFISAVLKDIASGSIPMSEYVFILPSKRAGLFLKKELAKQLSHTTFLPKIYSIEDFIEEIAQVKVIDNTTALFSFYEVYVTHTPKADQETFDVFYNWAQTLLYDFNEIDRYLIDANSFFTYLGRIQDINHWSLQPEKTKLVENYLKFWNLLPVYYKQFSKTLIKDEKAYQGLAYRTAAYGTKSYLAYNHKPHIFLGFNALNTAEQQIIQEFLTAGKAEIYWDADQYFLEHPYHDAALFLREYFNVWSYYKVNEPKWISNHFTQKKEFSLVGVSSDIQITKHVGEILSTLSVEDQKKTALILGNESLLLPMLNTIPSNILSINVTMGMNITESPVASFFEELFDLHVNPSKTKYYKIVLNVLSHNLIQSVFSRFSRKAIQKIQRENLIYVALTDLESIASTDNEKFLIHLIFDEFKSTIEFIRRIIDFIHILKASLSNDNQATSLQYLFKFNQVFERLRKLIVLYKNIHSISMLQRIYRDSLSAETIDFLGSPFDGLQLMGMLETRGLDFEHVIITNLNEGVLPAGKSANSFIPYDLKKEYGLPTYKEKDAIYTYHFYRLLHRAKKITLLYTTEPNSLLGGEKSRFIRQLEIEQQSQHTYRNYTVTSAIPTSKKVLKTIEKTTDVIDKIIEKASKGFSASALLIYLRNPVDFYYRYILGIEESDEVEETIAANTLGTIVHDTLEELFKPYIGHQLTADILDQLLKNSEKQVKIQFEKTYTLRNTLTGKNLIIFEVAKKYVREFLHLEKATLGRNTIFLKEVEQDLEIGLEIPELSYKVNLKGKIDRVDQFNNDLRIIDYKTGKVQQGQVILKDWDELITNYDDYSKPFQLLTYALLLHTAKKIELPVKAGIISFKNFSAGFIPLKEDKSDQITAEMLERFEQKLTELILEICDPNIPFQEKEIKPHYHGY
ncbi:PD-(D/E)XK nuclease family protein [Gangjinia marincola]|uniref:PD-(D/E)XK nuclease family protein n=1 Tax=Gangjinia marincola TaxID=578463 RepID=A0ABP3XW46_9FLAO